MKIDLIYPVLPPKLDGIGDYTALLAAELAKSHTVRILVDDQSTFTPINGVEIVPAYRLSDHATFHGLVDAVKQHQTDWAVLQYNPFGFGRRGYNLTLPRVMRRISKAGQTRVAMMTHEAYVPPEGLKFKVMRLWQLPQFRTLLKVAHVTFFSIQSRLATHQPWAPHKPMRYLPVGSNIPQVDISVAEARQRLGIEPQQIVLGVFGQAHVERSMEPIRQSIQALQKKNLPVTVLYIGPHGKQFRAELPDVPMITDGPHPADEVSRRLAAIDVFLVTYTDGISPRRGAFLAGLQHGLAISGTVTPATDVMLASENGVSYLLAPPDDFGRFAANVVRLAEDPSLRQQLGRHAAALFDRQFTWSIIAEKLASELAAADQSANERR